MVVAADRIILVDESILKSELGRSVPDKIDKPARGTRVARNFRVRRTNHIGQDHGFHALEFSGSRHLCGHFAAAEGVVAPVVVPLNAGAIFPMALSFFPVEESNPHVERVLAAAKEAREFKHRASAGTAIVRAHEVRDAHSVVVRGVKDNARARTVQFDDDVFHRQVAKHGRSMKVMLLDRASETLQLADDVLLRASDSIGFRRSRPDLHQVTHMFVSPRAIKCRGRIAREGYRWQSAEERRTDCRENVTSSHDFLVVRFSMRFSYLGPWKMASTKMPGV